MFGGHKSRIDVATLFCLTRNGFLAVLLFIANLKLYSCKGLRKFKGENTLLYAVPCIRLEGVVALVFACVGA